MKTRHNLGIRDFAASKKPVEIHFKIAGYDGVLTPDSQLLPSGVPASFICFIPGKMPTRITSINGEWAMNAQDQFVKALGAWIEAYYE